VFCAPYEDDPLLRKQSTKNKKQPSVGCGVSRDEARRFQEYRKRISKSITQRIGKKMGGCVL